MAAAKPKRHEHPPDDLQYPGPCFRRYSVEELARMQGVRPIENFDDLLGGWPDDIDDGFEEAVARWRGHDPDAEEEA